MHIRRYCLLSVVSVIVCQLMSCSCEKKKAEEPEFEPWEAPEVVDTIVDMPRKDVSDTVRISDAVYRFHFVLHKIDSLPTVKSFSGLEFHDNGVKLTVRSDSSNLFHKDFTKQSFKSLLPEKDYKKMSLTDFNYFNAKRDDRSKFHFLATISDPEDTDGYGYYIDVQISKSGDVHLEKAKEEDITTMPMDYSDEEEDV